MTSLYPKTCMLYFWNLILDWNFFFLNLSNINNNFYPLFFCLNKILFFFLTQFFLRNSLVSWKVSKIMFQFYYNVFSLIFTIRFKVFIHIKILERICSLSIKRKKESVCVVVCAFVILLTVLSTYNYYHKDMTRIDCKIVYMSVC